jgi:hypothetical protein
MYENFDHGVAIFERDFPHPVSRDYITLFYSVGDGMGIVNIGNITTGNVFGGYMSNDEMAKKTFRRWRLIIPDRYKGFKLIYEGKVNHG